MCGVSARAPELATATVSAVILGGGQGLRLGLGPKALVTVGGISMLEHVCQQIAPQVGQLLINTPQAVNTSVTSSHCPDAEFSGEGPLAGLLAGLQAADQAWLLFVPTDAIRLPRDLVSRLLLKTPPADAVVVAGQHACGLIRSDLASRLTTAMQQGTRSLRDWLSQIRTVEVDFADERAAIWSVNTPADLKRSEAALATPIPNP